MRQWIGGALAALCILAVALFLRLPRLNDRPFHADESVHAAKFQELWKEGRYRYDPDEYHGPTIYYATLPVMAVQGRTTFAQTREADYRLSLALLGGAMVLLFMLLRDGLGTAGALTAALLTAVSAPFVFYSRYFIQESALVAFTLGLIACGWRYRISSRFAWLVAAAVCAGLILATKETSVLTFGALGLAWLASRGLSRPQRREEQSGMKRLLAAALVALGVAYVLLSGFFSDPAGPLGYFQTYTPWLQRAGGTEVHRHPWHYYLSLLAWHQPRNGPLWTELPILALASLGALITALALFRSRKGARPAGNGIETDAARRGVFACFALVYTLILTAVYSAIPYKTPWNLLSFHLGFILLAGVGVQAVWDCSRSLPLRAVAALLTPAGAGYLGWQASRTTFDYRDDNPGPYAYAQTQRGVREMEQKVSELAAFSPRKEQTVAQVVFSNEYYWPLPFYLRRLRNVGYWTGPLPAEDQARLAEAPLVISSADLDEALTRRLGAGHFMIGFFSLRDGVLVQMWVKNDLWEPFIMSRSSAPRP